MVESDFFEQQKIVFSLFEQNKLNEAITVIEQIQKDFPDRLEKTSYWKACIYSLMNNKEDAIDVLAKALDQGIWWNPHLLINDPDFKGMQEFEEYQLIIEKCKQISEREIKSAKVELVTYGDSTAYVAIFSLHMRSMNVKDFSQFWVDQKVLNKYFLAFPQSSQVFGYNSFCWDEQEITKKDILECYQLLLKKYDLKDKKLILAGASQGGKVALEQYLEGFLPDVSGFILVVPSISKLETIENLLKQNKRKNLRGCIITGDQDHFYNNVLELIPILENNGVDCHLIVKEGLGHFFPDDFSNLVQEAVEFILRSEK